MNLVARSVVVLCFLWSLSFVALGATSSGKAWFSQVTAHFFNDIKGGTSILHLSIPVLICGWVCALLLLLPSDSGSGYNPGQGGGKYLSALPHQTPSSLQCLCRWVFGRRRGDRNFDRDAVMYILLPVSLNCIGSFYRHFHGHHYDASYKWQETGNAFGIVALILLSFQMIPVARHSLVLAAFGWSPAHAIRLHVWSGRIVVGAAIIHGFCQLRRRYLESSAPLFPPGPCWTLRESSDFHPACIGDSQDECSCYDSFRYLTGIFGTVALIVIALTSRNAVRRRAYWLFYRVHILAGPTVLLATILHWNRSILYMAGGLLYYIATSFPTMLESKMSTIATKESRSIRILSAERLSSAEHRPCVALTFEASETALERYRPGNYVKLRVPSISSISHPFTVNTIPGASTNQLRIIFRAMGPFTRHLADTLMNTPGDDIISAPVISMDGFRGSPNRVQHLLQHDAVLLVAGGIGITPFLSILHSLHAHLTRPGNSATTQKVVLLWACRDDQLVDYVKQHYFEPLLHMHSDDDDDDDSANFQLHIVLHRTQQCALEVQNGGESSSLADTEAKPFTKQSRTLSNGGTLDEPFERVEPSRSGVPFEPSKFASGSKTSYVAKLPLFFAYSVVAWLGLSLVWVIYENMLPSDTILPRIMTPIVLVVLGLVTALCVNAWYTVLGNRDEDTSIRSFTRWQAVDTSDNSTELEIVQSSVVGTDSSPAGTVDSDSCGDNENNTTITPPRSRQSWRAGNVMIQERTGRPVLQQVVESVLGSSQDPAVMVCGPSSIMQETMAIAKQRRIAKYHEAFEL